MSSQLVDRSHPVAEFAGRLCVRLGELAAVPTWSMSQAEQRATLVDLAPAAAQVEALRLRVLAEADRTGAGDLNAAASAADWAAVATCQTKLAARSDLKLAKALESYPLLSEAFGCGHVNHAQVRVIVTALDRLPPSGEFAVTPEQRHRAEAHLVGLAGEHDAKALRVLGRAIFEVIAPAVAEAFEGRVLEAQEAAAARRTWLVMGEDEAGTCHGRFRIPSLHGQMFPKLIGSLTTPTTDPAERLPALVEHGQAFCDLLERIPADALSQAGGCAATVVVTMTLDQLLDGLGAAGVDTGVTVSAQMGEDQGPPLDKTLGQGGPTSLENGRLLCGHHHRRIHDPAYEATHHPASPNAPAGKVSFHRRP